MVRGDGAVPIGSTGSRLSIFLVAAVAGHLILRNQAGVTGAHSHGIHVVNDGGPGLGRICGRKGGRLDGRGGDSQVDGVVVAVDLGGANTGQGDILLVDLDLTAIIVSVNRGLHDLDLVTRIRGDLLQGVHTGVVHAVGAPSIHMGAVLGAGKELALAHIDRDGLHAAIQEDDIGIGILGGQVAGVALHAGEEHILVGLGVLLNADQVAVGIEDHIVGGVLQIGLAVVVQHLDVVLGGVGILIGGALHGDILVQLEAVDGGVRDNLGGDHGLHLAGGHGDEVLVVLLHVLHVDIVILDRGGILLLISGLDEIRILAGAEVVDGVDLNINLFVLGIVVLGSDSQIGVDDDDLHIVLGLVLALNPGDKDLRQNALLGGAHAVVVGALDNTVGEHGGVILHLGLAVDVDGQHVILQMLHHVLGDGVVQVLAGDLGGELSHQIGVIQVGANDLLVVGPGVGGTAEVVNIRLQLQLGQVLLTKLDGVVIGVGELLLGDGLSTGNGGGHIAGLLVAQGDLGAVDGDGGLLVVLNQRGLDSVQSHLSSLLTADLSGAEHLLQTVVQTDLHADGGHGDGPAGASEALQLAVIADGGEQHLGEGVAGQLAGGIEVAVAGAINDT